MVVVPFLTRRANLMNRNCTIDACRFGDGSPRTDGDLDQMVGFLDLDSMLDDPFNPQVSNRDSPKHL
jgi:hypothetical protein